MVNPDMALDPKPEPGVIMPKPVVVEPTPVVVALDPALVPKDPIMEPNEAVWAKALADSSSMAEKSATANNRFMKTLLLVQGSAWIRPIAYSASSKFGARIQSQGNVME